MAEERGGASIAYDILFHWRILLTDNSISKTIPCEIERGLIFFAMVGINGIAHSCSKLKYCDIWPSL